MRTRIKLIQKPLFSIKNTFKTISLLLVFSLIFTSCKNDETEENMNPTNYAEITKDDIAAKEATMSSNMIEATNANGHVLDVGDVLVYKTNNDHFGKLEILAIDDADNYKLTIKAVTYDASGSVFSQTASLDIRGTWLCDLDAMEEDGTSPDFKWRRLTETDTNLEPRGSALFAVYNF